MDTLRAFAIALMIVDHAALMLGGMSIEPPNLRFFTRFAEPLFAVLFGYMLAGRGRKRVLARLWQLGLAALLVNTLFWPTFGHAEILADFILVVAIYLAIGERLVWLLPAFLLTAWDPTTAFLDYPLAVVVSQVALGMLLKTAPRHGLAAAVLFVAAPLFAPSEDVYKLVFTLPAALLVMLAVWRPGLDLALLTRLGRRPLTVYVLQWGLIYATAIGLALSVPGSRSAWVVRRLEQNLHLSEPRVAFVPPSDLDPISACLVDEAAAFERRSAELAAAVARSEIAASDVAQRRSALMADNAARLGRCNAL